MASVVAVLPPGWRLDLQGTLTGYRFDGLIRSDTKSIVVEAFYNQGFTGGEFSRAIRSACQSEPPSINAALVIARSRNALGFTRLEADFNYWQLRHKILAWQPESQDEHVLTEAVRELIRELG